MAGKRISLFKRKKSKSRGRGRASSKALATTAKKLGSKGRWTGKKTAVKPGKGRPVVPTPPPSKPKKP